MASLLLVIAFPASAFRTLGSRSNCRISDSLAHDGGNNANRRKRFEGERFFL